MATKKNIIVGAARVFIGPSIDPVNNAAQLTALKPANTVAQNTHMALTAQTGTYNGTTGGWRDVGYTQDGVEVANDPSWTDVEVDQLLDAAKIFKDGMGFTVGTTFAEATLENLIVAWGQSDSLLVNDSVNLIKEAEVDGGSLGVAPFERGLICVGNAPEKTGSNNYGERVYFVYRVLAVDASSHQLARADATTIPVSFRALPADNGKYGSIRDRLGTLA